MKEAAIQYGGFCFYHLAASLYFRAEHVFERIEAGPAREGAEDWHQDVIYKGCDNLAERAAYDDAHSHVDDVAFQYERFEFFHYIVQVTHFVILLSFVVSCVLL